MLTTEEAKQERMSEFERKSMVLGKKIQLEESKNETLDQKIADAKRNIKEAKEMQQKFGEKGSALAGLGSVNKFLAYARATQKRIRVHEATLRRITGLHDKVVDDNNKLREDINALRQYTTLQNNRFKQLSSNLDKKKEELAQLMIDSDDLLELRESIREQHKELEAEDAKAQEEHDEQIDLLERAKKENLDTSDAVFLTGVEDEVARGGLSMNQERTLRRKNAEYLKKIKVYAEEGHGLDTTIHKYETAFNAILEFTENSDIRDALKGYLEEADAIYALYGYLQHTNKEIQSTEKDIAAMEDDLKKFHEPPPGAKARAPPTEAVEARNARLTAMKDENAQLAAQVKELRSVLNTLAPQVQRLFQIINESDAVDVPASPSALAVTHHDEDDAGSDEKERERPHSRAQSPSRPKSRSRESLLSGIRKSEVAEIEELEKTGVSDSTISRVMAVLEHATRSLTEEFTNVLMEQRNEKPPPSPGPKVSSKRRLYHILPPDMRDDGEFAEKVATLKGQAAESPGFSSSEDNNLGSRAADTRPPSRGTEGKRDQVKPLPHDTLMRQVEEEFGQLGKGVRHFIRPGKVDKQLLKKRQTSASAKANGGDKKLKQQQILAITQKIQARIAAQSGSTISVMKDKRKKKHAASGPLPGIRPSSQPENNVSPVGDLRVNTAASLPELRASGPFHEYDEESYSGSEEEVQPYQPQHVPSLPRMHPTGRRRIQLRQEL